MQSTRVGRAAAQTTLPAPGDGEVHVWTASSRGGLVPLDQLRQSLGAEDLAQADRFKFEAHRQRHLSTRLMRRRVLAMYVGLPAADLAFRYGDLGKPELASGLDRGLNFSQTESDGLAVLAVASDRRLGVDVESRRPVPEAEDIVQSFASPAERAAFEAIAPDHRAEAFLRWWTAKEAYVKAVGHGLSDSLAGFTVTIDSRGAPQLVDPAGWSLSELAPAAGFVGALVSEGPVPLVIVRSV